MIVTPNLGLTVWNLLTDPYDSTQIADNWARIDQHDHSPGQGVPINGATSIADGTITASKFAVGAAVPDNSVTTSKIVAGAVTADGLADAARLGLTDSSNIRRGYLSIPTSQSVTSTTYTSLATPDQLPITMVSGGWLMIGFQGQWFSSVSAAGSAAIFVNGNQIRIQSSAGPVVQSATTVGVGQNSLYTSVAGLGAASNTATDGNTQIIGFTGAGGIITSIAPAGTYNVGIQFKSTSGSVTASARQLWVMAIGF